MDDKSVEFEAKTTAKAEVKEDLSKAERKRFRDYLFFFSGQQLSILGSSVVSFALIWWITEMTQSELMLGIASFVSLGPYLLVVPFSGVIADRGNKKKLLLIFDSLQALFTVILTIIFMVFYDPNSTEYNTLLLVAIFITLGLRGAMQAFHQPVVSVLVPTMVPKKRLSQMNGMGFLISGIIQIAGPALGALLLSVLGMSLTLWIDAVTFAIAVIPLVLIKIPHTPKKKGAKKEKILKVFFGEFTDGLRTIKSIKGMFALLLIAAAINFFFTPVSTLLPIFVNKVHSGTDDNYALVVGIMQIGVIVGALFMTFFKGFKNKILSAIVCVGFMFTAMSMLVLVPTTLSWRFILIGVILFFGILPNPAANVSLQTTWQLIIPKEKLGRVSSVLSFVAMAISPIGNLLSGIIGEFVPIGWFITGSSIVGFSLMILIYLVTPARNLDKVIKQKLQEAKELELRQKTDEELLEEMDEIFGLGEGIEKESILQFDEVPAGNESGKP